jgi:hypothetical protein
MSKMISVGKSPRIIADSIGGDVSVVGWDGSEILVKADDDELNLQQNGDEIHFSCQDDVSIRVPKDSKLSFVTIRGDAAVRGVLGDIEIKEITGIYPCVMWVPFRLTRSTPILAYAVLEGIYTCGTPVETSLFETWMET